MRKIQAGCVAWLVNLLGIRWSSSVCRAQVAPIVQYLVLRQELGGIDSSDKYSACKNANQKSEFHFLQSIQQTQNKTAKQHRDKIRELVMEFFTATSDKMINTIKQEVFDVADGAPIVGRDHPVVQAMMALPAPVKNDVTCMHPSPARAGTARHARMRARRARRALRALITCAVCPGDFVLFENLKDVQNDRTTCFGSLELPCQKSLHALLGEIPATPAAPMLPCSFDRVQCIAISYTTSYVDVRHRMLTYDIVC